MRTVALVAVTVALGAVLGAAVAETVDADLDDARSLATAVVPPEARVLEVYENADFPLLPRTSFVHVDAEGATVAQLRAHLPTVGVAVAGVQVFPGGTRLRGSRGRVQVLVTAQTPSSLSIKATPTGPSRALSALTGALLLPAVALGVRRARRPGRASVGGPEADAAGPRPPR